MTKMTCTVPARPARYHRKGDGILRVGADGSSRYLTFFETVLFRFGYRSFRP